MKHSGPASFTSSRRCPRRYNNTSSKTQDSPSGSPTETTPGGRFPSDPRTAVRGVVLCSSKARCVTAPRPSPTTSSPTSSPMRSCETAGATLARIQKSPPTRWPPSGGSLGRRLSPSFEHPEPSVRGAPVHLPFGQVSSASHRRWHHLFPGLYASGTSSLCPVGRRGNPRSEYRLAGRGRRAGTLSPDLPPVVETVAPRLGG